MSSRQVNKSSVKQEGKSGRLVDTLADGRHRTNLNVLIKTEHARTHFKQIAEIVKNQRKNKS